MVPAGKVGVLSEQVREALRRDAPALVGDRDRDLDAVSHRVGMDGGGFRRVSRGFGEQVVQHLHDAPLVGHHRRQVLRQVEAHGLAGAAAQVRGARLLHRGGDLHRLRVDRERARFDAPRVEPVADQPLHAVGLLVDD